ncbi:unnamed protein product [Didymodactylos carnosus]|uniref:Uncharacterized protein n=1 Tax=Didymodactylos carnosus TaxID=1234261 RepID=A0A814EQ41_9BILA|nr:unnamed protein product [Didymodactylos carnosus]CAF0976881.1 unnamed protein product [Didymodactylos carnosus]CAF3747277.1 unnamed protein product [Didymodactylos carnosus]CAF3747651.1 unnamed protein product [Didymodactylos carnosus]
MTHSQHRTQVPDDNLYTLNTYLDNVPFLFNKKYIPINVPDHDIPDYDTRKVQEILTRPCNFTLEKKVLQEALDDVRRRRLEIEADGSKRLNATTTLPQTGTNLTVTANEQQQNLEIDPHQLVEIQTQKRQRAITTTSIPSLTHYLPTPTSNQQHHRHSAPPPPQIPQQTSTMFRLPSVRDIYWPMGQNYAQQQPTAIPTTLLRASQTISNGSTTDGHVLNQLGQLNVENLSFNNCDEKHMLVSNTVPSSSVTTTPTSLSSTSSSILNPKLTDAIISSKTTTNQANVSDLSTFDPSLSDTHDPFHEAELRSIDDAVALRQLYTITSQTANTIRR